MLSFLHIENALIHYRFVGKGCYCLLVWAYCFCEMSKNIQIVVCISNVFTALLMQYSDRPGTVVSYISVRKRSLSCLVCFHFKLIILSNSLSSIIPSSL